MSVYIVVMSVFTAKLRWVLVRGRVLDDYNPPPSCGTKGILDLERARRDPSAGQRVCTK